MQVAELEKLLSQSRLATYYQLFPNDKQIAIEYYQLNTQIAESLYPLLSLRKDCRTNNRWQGTWSMQSGRCSRNQHLHRTSH